MEWINELIFGSGVAHAIFVLALVISIGILLGKIKIFGADIGKKFPAPLSPDPPTPLVPPPPGGGGVGPDRGSQD